MDTSDNLEDNENDIMSQPGMREKIEEYAKRTGLSFEEAKNHFISQKYE